MEMPPGHKNVSMMTFVPGTSPGMKGVTFAIEGDRKAVSEARAIARASLTAFLSPSIAKVTPFIPGEVPGTNVIIETFLCPGGISIRDGDVCGGDSCRYEGRYLCDRR